MYTRITIHTYVYQIHLYYVQLLHIYNMHIIHLYLTISSLLLLAYNCIFKSHFWLHLTKNCIAFCYFWLFICYSSFPYCGYRPLTVKIRFLGSWNLYYTKCALMSFLSANGLHNQEKQ